MVVVVVGHVGLRMDAVKQNAILEAEVAADDSWDAVMIVVAD